MKKGSLVALLLLSLLPARGLAHYLWVQPQAEGFFVARGLLPDTFYEYAPENVKDIKAFDAKGKPLGVKRQPTGQRLYFQTEVPPALVAVVAEWGHRVNTPHGKEFSTKAEALARGLTVEEAFFSIQTSKTILTPGPVATQALGLPLEIVPRQDPLAVGPGQELTVQVLFNGQPLPNTRVRVEKVKELYATDAQGEVRLHMAAAGPAVIMASHNQPTPGRPDIDYIQYMTFLIWPKP